MTQTSNDAAEPVSVASAPDEIAFASASLPPAPTTVKPAWLQRIRTNGTTDKDGTISLSAASVQPLYQNERKTDTIFTQVNVDSSAQTEAPSGTSHVGLGYRYLPRRDLLLGVNGFYDRDWQQTVDRTSADAEMQWRAFKMAVNYYDGRSGANGDRRALDGYDIQLGSQVPYLPWAQTTFARSDFFGADRAAAESYSAGMKLDLMKYLQLDMGVRSDGTSPEAGIVKLNFNLLPSQWGPQRRTAFGSTLISDRPLENRDLAPATLDRVRRLNAIATDG